MVESVAVPCVWLELRGGSLEEKKKQKNPDLSVSISIPWWLSSKRIHLQCRRCRRHGFDPWVGKIPWRRKWQPTPVLLPGKIPWTEKPCKLQSLGSQRVRQD